MLTARVEETVSRTNSDIFPSHLSQGEGGFRATSPRAPMSTQPASLPFNESARSVHSPVNPTFPALKPQKRLPSCSSESNVSSHSRSPLQTWLETTQQPSDNSTATTQISPERGIRVNALKRKRDTPVDLDGQSSNIPLTKRALRQHLVLTMSSDQSTVINVCQQGQLQWLPANVYCIGCLHPSKEPFDQHILLSDACYPSLKILCPISSLQ